MSAPLVAYDWAYIRVVPAVETGDGVTVGVALHARRAGVLALRFVEAPGALSRSLAARTIGLDAPLLARALRAAVAVAEADPAGGPLALLPPSERFHWLVATRSTVLQAGPVRTGMAVDPADEAERIVADLRDRLPWRLVQTAAAAALSARRDLRPPRGV